MVVAHRPLSRASVDHVMSVVEDNRATTSSDLEKEEATRSPRRWVYTERAEVPSLQPLRYLQVAPRLLPEGGECVTSEDELVYGLIDSTGDPRQGYLVFVRRSRTEDLARVHDAVGRARTWSEFRSLLPPTFEEELEKSFHDDEVDAPDDSQPFDADRIPGYADGDWPAWPAQEALDWVPSEISARFGRDVDSVLNGPYLEFDPKHEVEILAAFEGHGFRCGRDDKLVRQASGWG
jgi:hypothetical protein